MKYDKAFRDLEDRLVQRRLKEVQDFLLTRTRIMGALGTKRFEGRCVREDPDRETHSTRQDPRRGSKDE